MKTVQARIIEVPAKHRIYYAGQIKFKFLFWYYWDAVIGCKDINWTARKFIPFPRKEDAIRNVEEYASIKGWTVEWIEEK